MRVPFDRDRLALPDRRGALGEGIGPAATALASLIAAGVLLAGCGTDGGEPTSAPATSQTATPFAPTHGGSSADTPTTDTAAEGPTDDAPTLPENPAPRTGRGSGKAELVLSDVRVAEHERFDRLVLEFTGPGTPGWRVNYVDEPALDGSGEAVTLDGDAFLDVYASDTTWPAPDYYAGPRRLEVEPGGITDLYVAGTFEGYTQVLAGIDGAPVPFRVFALTEPSRLVVDVLDESVD